MTRLMVESLIISFTFLGGAGIIDAVGHPATFAKMLPQAVAKEPSKAESDKTILLANDAVDDARIFNNRIKVLWLCLGALGGAWCFFAYNLIKTQNFSATMNRLKTTCYITVAFISSLFATPWTLLHFNVPTPEETCAFAGFFASIVSWGGIEVVTILMRKLGVAAEKKGIAGVKEFVTGTNQNDSSQQTSAD